MTTSQNKPPLSGLRVVDFGQYLAGPLTAMFLADSGADVIHVDPPGGPRWNHPVNATLQRGKRCVELDLTTDEGRAEAARLVATADVVIEGFRPGVMARLGLDPETCRESAPTLVWCSLPGFGREDPRAGVAAWEGVLCAATGLYRSGLFDADPAPQFNPLTLASNFAAFVAAHRIVAALVARERSGVGAFLEVSLYDACFQAIGFHSEVPTSRQVVDPLSHWLHADMGPCRAKDGSYVYFDSPTRGLQAFLNHFLPGYDLLDADDATLAEIGERLGELIAERPAEEWERIGQEEFHGAIGIAQTIDDWLHDIHANDADDVLVLDDPQLGRVIQAGYPVQLSGTRLAARSPRVQVARDGTPIDWLDDPWETVVSPEDSSRNGSGLPLQGTKVVDFSTLLAGPNTTRVLAQYGAQVIKIDKTAVCIGNVNPLADDPMAFIGHRTVNAGKRMVFLDLAQPAGRDAVAEILRASDVICHNFTPSGAERLGLSLQQVRALNPHAVYTTVSLHSHGGYRQAYRGHDPMAQMATGMSSLLGGSGEPRMASIVLNDHATGHLAAFGVMLALLHQRRTGETQEVNCSLARTATLHLVPFMLDYDRAAGHEPHRDQSIESGPLNRFYRAQDGYFFLAHHGSGGREMLSETPMLAGVDEVGEADLQQWLAERFATSSVADCVQDLSKAGFGAHRYFEMADVVIDDLTLQRGLTAVIDHPGIGRALGVAHPMLGSAGHAGEFLAARRPGMDTLDVLTEYGSADQIVNLLSLHAAAVGENPVVTTTTVPGYWPALAGGPKKDMTAAMSRPPTAEVIRCVTESTPRPTYVCAPDSEHG